MGEVATLLWQRVTEAAQRAGLDATKFGEQHRQLVEAIADFLERPFVEVEAKGKNGRLARWRAPFRRAVAEAPVVTPVSPHILCGEPGTGKTTFLYLLDYILRSEFDLPDNVAGVMAKNGRWQHNVAKRYFNRAPISLLSVKKWTELIHFYAWDVEAHGFDEVSRTRFIYEQLRPMRVIFADEVETAGYAPTLPNLAKAGILVVGTSNQYQFAQLIRSDLSPQTYLFGGDDMRFGDPADAVVWQSEPLWHLFDEIERGTPYRFERLTYWYEVDDGVLYAYFDFSQAVRSPLLESSWIELWQLIHEQAFPDGSLMGGQTACTLLFDEFALETVQTDYNALIRFVSLFDAIEQMGLGVLVRNQAHLLTLSHQSFSYLRNTIQYAKGVPEEVRQRTIVGIARCASRIGQAAHRARAYAEGDA